MTEGARARITQRVDRAAIVQEVDLVLGARHADTVAQNGSRDANTRWNTSSVSGQASRPDM